MESFTKINIEKWERGKLFRYYIEKLKVVTSMTVNIDVMPLIDYAKVKKMHFYPIMIWIVSKVINSHAEFKYSFDEQGELICWDSISPSYTVFNKEKEFFSNFTTKYYDELTEFYQQYLKDMKAHENDIGIDDNQPKSIFNISCIPWSKYSHIDFHVFNEGKYLAPIITWGRYEVEGTKAIMPLSINIHHAVADGFHISRFFNEVQDMIDALF